MYRRAARAARAARAERKALARNNLFGIDAGGRDAGTGTRSTYVYRKYSTCMYRTYGTKYVRRLELRRGGRYLFQFPTVWFDGWSQSRTHVCTVQYVQSTVLHCTALYCTLRSVSTGRSPDQSHLIQLSERRYYVESSSVVLIDVCVAQVMDVLYRSVSHV